MSIFASKTQSDPMPLPFDPPHTVTVRKLTAREVEMAQAAHAHGVATSDTRLWATRFRRILENSLADKAQVEQAIADPLTGYDRFSIVRSGLVAWSYPESITPIEAAAAVKANGKTPASPAVEARDAIADMDDESIDFVATAILKLTKPWLFLTAEQLEAQKKTG